MVECECEFKIDLSGRKLVLIDTWWNVNCCIICSIQFKVSGFNRYMVECEYALANTGQVESTGFNRYMVECEFRLFIYDYIE